MPSTPIASVDGLRYQACSSSESVLGFVGHAVDEALQLLDRLGLREQRDDDLTTASATKAAIAPQNAAAWADPRLMMSQLSP